MNSRSPLPPIAAFSFAFVLGASVRSPAATAVPTTTAEAAAAGYVTMKAADAWGNCFTYSTLLDGSSAPYAGRVWSDGSAIGAGKNYFAHTTTVAGGGTGNTPATLTIPGQAGDIFVYSGGTHSFRNTTTLDFGARRIVVRNGAKIVHYSSWMTAKMNALEVQATASSPFIYSANIGSASKSNIQFGTLKGESDAVMLVQPDNTISGSHIENMVGDASGYFGKVEVNGNGKLSTAGAVYYLMLNCPLFGGTVEAGNRGGVRPGTSVSSLSLRALSLQSGGVWEPGAKTWTIGDLCVADGAAISGVTASTRIVVTNAISRGTAPVTFDFGGASLFSYGTNTSVTKPAETNVLLTLASGVAASLDDFAVVNVGTGSYGIPHWRLELIPGENGSTVLALVHDPVVIATGSGLTPSSTTWSDDRAVHGGAEYYAKWYSFSPDVAGKGEYVFPGSGLTTIGSVTPWCEGTVITNLVLPVRKSGEDAVRLNFYASGLPAGHDRLQYIAGGKVTVPAHSDATAVAVFQGYLNNYFRLDSSLEGDGNIVIRVAPGVSDPHFRAGFTGLNTNYTGKISVTGDVSFHLWDARNVGGPLGAFAWNGFTIANGSCVVVTNDLLFDASLNRGVSIVAQGRLNVAVGATLTLATPVTYAGQLIKEGEGVLALAARPCFIDGDEATAPVAGTNALHVASGALKVAGAQALNGLAVTFAEGTELHVPAATVDADLAAYGAVMTKALSSLAVESGRIALVADGFDTSAHKVVCPVATFATRVEADAAAAAMKPAKLANGLPGTVAVSQTAAGHTIVASWEQGATILTIR